MKLFNHSIILFLCVVFLTPIAEADDYGWFRKTHDSKVEAYNEWYEEECGACHFPYQPGLLPKRSWKKLLATLDDHFGEIADIDDNDDLSIIRNYLLENSADKSDFQLPKKIIRSLPLKATPIRISEVPYIKDKHKSVPWKALMEKDKANSKSRCRKCHISSEM